MTNQELQVIAQECAEDIIERTGVKHYRDMMKKWYKKIDRQSGQIKAPLYACDRTRYTDWDSRKDYGFFVGTGWTDDEIREEIEAMTIRVNSPYDCTGRPFTITINWHRNPSGLISYVHWIGYDI